MAEKLESACRSGGRHGLACASLFVVSATLLGLGAWQWDRAAHYESLLEKYLAASDLPVIAVDETGLDPDVHLYRRLSVAGRYLPEHSLLLDGQVYSGQKGYHVYTPFRLLEGANEEGIMGSRVLLINRGWIPSKDRYGVPFESDTPAGELSVSGRLDLPPSRPVFFGKDELIATGMVWRFIDIAAVSAWTGLDIEPLVLLLDSSLQDAGGFERTWERINDAGVQRKYSYAWICFLFASLASLASVYLLYRGRDVP